MITETTTETTTPQLLHPYLREGHEVTTRAGVKIQLSRAPHWSEHYRCWYVAGYKWIASKGKFSGMAREWGAL